MLIREMQSKMPVRYPIHLLEWLKLGRPIIASVVKDVKELELSPTHGSHEFKMVEALRETVW